MFSSDASSMEHVSFPSSRSSCSSRCQVAELCLTKARSRAPAKSEEPVMACRSLSTLNLVRSDPICGEIPGFWAFWIVKTSVLCSESENMKDHAIVSPSVLDLHGFGLSAASHRSYVFMFHIACQISNLHVFPHSFHIVFTFVFVIAFVELPVFA